ncbi:glycosyltransferase family 2 protein [Acidovorax sp. NB1]|uniref:glycosyltransferase family 2 protein n=1 Tax=Acidovorax sp. NB1 TaxID=1943571 RepID=UPI0010F49B2F|nr:glycosyltransferase family 2 protein [Acidovorax sp. NB1]
MEQHILRPPPASITVICPMKNEAVNLPAFFARLVPVIESIASTYEILCVNDGSDDDTLATLLLEREKNPHVRIADLSRNFGKEAALTCGIELAQGEIVVPMDADLQHPPETIVEMVQRWREGYDVVLAKRKNRETEGWLRRKTAKWFYSMQNEISEVEIPADVGDFRLMDRKVIDALKRLPERRRFMKGLFAWVGFPHTTVTFVCEPRLAGNSKFSGWRLWNFALEGITSFSTVPLRVWTYIGSGISALAFISAIFLIIKTLIFGRDVPGYASLITSSLFLGGLQLAGLGILGEYIGRIYGEVKQRPIYVIRDFYDFPSRP